ncbi:hypothetical protein [Eubacterium sp.]|uniref:hypothetical protein n=1 Tax=Eubacterium sp. TaxID=142586 RepID=UPI00258EAF68|nr:hypothetical protein [Eubacterium sp.]MCR5367236.1 hypothetical protein [Eubacterium sp.]
MEQRAITQMEKSKKMSKAEEKFRQAQAVYERAVKDEKERVRKIQDHHKYMMGGCVLKYFPEGYNAYEFDEPEMNRIIACAFSLNSVQNMVRTVVKERPMQSQECKKPADENITFEAEKNEVEETNYEMAESEETDDAEEADSEGEN